MNKEKIIIFDTTLRDGEQSLSSSLSAYDKLKIAFALEELGVDVIEAGFPSSSLEDFKSSKLIREKIKGPTICGLSRALPKDIETTAESLKGPGNFRIHTFVPTSSIHVQDKLKMKWEDVVLMAKNAVKLARKYTDDIEFSCEDASRTSLEHLVEIINTVIKEGANTINIPDTVGYSHPAEFGELVRKIIENVKDSDKVTFSVHCHDDLGLSVANSLMGISGGARQVECTINGLGERAGNCSLEEITAILKTRINSLPFYTDIDLSKIYKTSQIVSQLCNVPVASNKAIVGGNAFSHSSGIHQDGILKNRKTYEILDPVEVGLPGHKISMTSRSGKSIIKHKLKNLGYKEKDFNLADFYQSFCHLADKKGVLYDYDLESLFWLKEKDDASFSLEHFRVSCSSSDISHATVLLSSSKQFYPSDALGDGPVDSLIKAIKKVINKNIVLSDYKITSKGVGSQAIGQADIWVDFDKKTFHGRYKSNDIIEASARAYLNAVNCVLSYEKVRMKKIENEVSSRECYI